jgi:hypothetical protein
MRQLSKVKEALKEQQGQIDRLLKDTYDIREPRRFQYQNKVCWQEQWGHVPHEFIGTVIDSKLEVSEYKSVTRMYLVLVSEGCTEWKRERDLAPAPKEK